MERKNLRQWKAMNQRCKQSSRPCFRVWPGTRTQVNGSARSGVSDWRQNRFAKGSDYDVAASSSWFRRVARGLFCAGNSSSLLTRGYLIIDSPQVRGKGETLSDRALLQATTPLLRIFNYTSEARLGFFYDTAPWEESRVPQLKVLQCPSRGRNTPRAETNISAQA